MGNIDDIIMIYEELEKCTNHEEVLSLKEKLKGLVSGKSSANKELKIKEGKRRVEDLCRYSDKLIQEAKELVAQGEFPNGLIIDAPDEVIVKLPTAEMEGEKFEDNVEYIWRCLMKTEVSIIGILGMGGVGKTTLMTHIYNQVLERKDVFGCAYWVTVSKDSSIHQLQHDIAECVGEEYISKETDQLKRAGLLTQALEKKNKFILFLDDMWNYFDLSKKVGIPKKSECKVILTTRSEQICKEIRCDEIIKVDTLLEHEAWDLFVKNMEHDILPPIVEIAMDVVKECAGLPLGIVTLARSMWKSTDICEWRSVLNKLRKSKGGVSTMEDDVFKVLKLSYDHLNNSVAQECLLYCATYPEDYRIRREELIWVLIGKGLFVGMNSMDEMIDEGHHMLNELERACLLSGFVCRYGHMGVKMHDLIRDMALQIAGSRFMIKDGPRLIDFPDEAEWREDLEVVSLMCCRNFKVPNVSPECARLKILLLKDTDLTVPESFFEHMHGLKVLDFSRSNIGTLPNSISYLKTLTALLFKGCKFLRYIPSLANMTALLIPDLTSTSIRTVPKGLEELNSLRYLNLTAVRIKNFPCGVLPKLFRLQYLLLPKIKVNGRELIGLRKLERIEGYLPDIDNFNAYVGHINMYGGPSSYILRVGHDFSPYTNGPKLYVDYTNMDALHNWNIEWMLPKDVRDLLSPYIDASELPINRRKRDVILTNFDKISETELPKDTWYLHIEASNDIRSLCDISSLNNATCLESCTIVECMSMEYVLSSLLSPTTFSQCKKFCIYNCPSIKQLFTTEVLSQLQNVEDICIIGCKRLEAIIGASPIEVSKKKEPIATRTFTLPNLIKLKLENLPELKRICSCGFFKCRIPIYGIALSHCPKLRLDPVAFDVES